MLTSTQRNVFVIWVYLLAIGFLYFTNPGAHEVTRKWLTGWSRLLVSVGHKNCKKGE